MPGTSINSVCHVSTENEKIAFFNDTGLCMHAIAYHFIAVKTKQFTQERLSIQVKLENQHKSARN